MKKQLKIYLLSFLPSKLPENLLAKYWIVLSQLIRLFGNTEYIRSIKKFHEIKSYNLIMLKMSDGELLIQDLSRVSRFIKGKKHAFDRLYAQYVNINDELITLLNSKKNKIIIFDIGANIGEFAFSVAKKFPGCLVYAFEPDPLVFECLKYNVRVNNSSSSIKIFNRALSNETGFGSFYVSTASADSSLIEPKNFTEILNISVVRGDEFMNAECVDYVSLLKMDAEGFEPEVLNGFGDKINAIDFFAIDVGPERKGQATDELVSEVLSSRGLFINVFDDGTDRKFVNAYRKN